MNKREEYNFFRTEKEKQFSTNLMDLIYESPKVQKSHENNELHRYKEEMMYLIKEQKYSARKARDIVSDLASINGFLPVKI